MKKYLITGGAGFIGYHLANRLKNKNNKIYILDLKKKINKKKHQFKHCELIVGDISKKNTFNKIKKKFDTIFHLAAKTSTQVAELHPEDCLNTNVLGTLNLFQWAKIYKPKRIIFTSSMAVYGKNADSAKEDQKCKPSSIYGISKLSAEKILMKLRDINIQIIIMRLFNVYGPKQDFSNLKQGMLSIYLSQIFKKHRVKITGSLKRYRDFVFIDDVIDALTLNLPRKNSGIFNVGSGKPTKVYNLIRLIFSTLKIRISKNSIMQLKPHAGDTWGSFGNINKLKKYKWKPKFSLVKGLRKTILDLKTSKI